MRSRIYLTPLFRRFAQRGAEKNNYPSCGRDPSQQDVQQSYSLSCGVSCLEDCCGYGIQLTGHRGWSSVPVRRSLAAPEVMALGSSRLRWDDAISIRSPTWPLNTNT